MADLQHAVAQAYGVLGLKPRSASQILETLKAESGVEANITDGFLSLSQTGTELNVSVALQSYFKKHPEQFHGYAGEIKYKSDLGNDLAAKARLVADKGYAWWEALPATSNSPNAQHTIHPIIASTQMTQKEWKQLTPAERSAAISSWGSDALHTVEVIMARR
jgi:hypothetical protein